jgi:hypothetical protein
MAKAASRSAIDDWGVPDPRDAADYPPATSATSMVQWGWEFLRRRSDYRLCWEQKVSPFLNERGDGLDLAATERRCRELLTQAREASAKSENRGFAWVSAYIPWLTRWISYPVAAGSTEPIAEEWVHTPPFSWELLHKKFRVSLSGGNGTLDPRCKAPPLFDGTFVSLVSKTEHPDPNKVLLEVDLTLPISAQLARALPVLLEQQAEVKAAAGDDIRPRVDKFPEYLRMLDFDAINASDAEIGKHLFQNHSGDLLRDHCRKSLEAARRWQDRYLAIALYDPAAS